MTTDKASGPGKRTGQKPVYKKASAEKAARKKPASGHPKRRGKQAKTKHKRPNSRRKQGNLVGLLVFLVGLGAVIAAGYALSQRGPVTIMGAEIDVQAFFEKLMPEQGTGVAPSEEEAEIATQNDTDRVGDARRTKTPQNQSAVRSWYERRLNPSALPQAFTGHYMANYGGRTFELFLNEGVYQIVFSESGETLRYYSKGRYGYNKGLLALKPDPDMGAPDNPGNKFQYRSMTESIFTVHPERMNEFLIWDPGAKIYNGVERVAKHPIFQFVDVNRIIWQPIKADTSP